MMHASYAFPSEWILVLEIVLLTLALAAAAAAPAPAAAAGRRLWRGLCSLTGRGGERQMRAIAVVAVAAAAGTAAVHGINRLPVPQVADELAYLVTADTFAHGRLTNPAPAHWQHFESPHVIVQPTYNGKYPPAQALLLGAGQALGGHPAVGLWLAAGLLTLAVGWMLTAWLPAPWPLLGAVLVALRLGAGSYWQQTYWGGAAAAIGGALLYGALRRLIGGQPRPRHAVLLALGVAVLANSRPYEGLVVALPAAAVLGVWALRHLVGRVGGSERLSGGVLARRVILPAALTLGLAFAAMGFYNLRVTGDPLVMPYKVHERTYSIRPLFRFQEPQPEPEYRHEPIRRFQLQVAGLGDYEGPWIVPGIRLAWRSLSFTWYVFLGLAASLGAFAAASVLREPWMRLAAGVWALLVVSHALIHSWWLHYSAPVAGLLFALALAGLRRVRAWRLRGRRVGAFLVLSGVAINAVLFAVQIPAHRVDDGHWSLRRATLLERLGTEGRYLLLVRNHTPATWEYNGADLEAEPVLLARSMGPEEDRALAAAHPDREVLYLDVEADGEPRLTPFAAESRQ